MTVVRRLTDISVLVMVVGAVIVISTVVSRSLIVVSRLIFCLVIVLIEETVVEIVMGITDVIVSVLSRIVNDVETAVKVVVLSLNTAFLVVDTENTVADNVTVDVFGLLFLVIVWVRSFVIGTLRCLTNVDVMVYVLVTSKLDVTIIELDTVVLSVT